VTHLTHLDLLTHLTRDPLTHCHLCWGVPRVMQVKTALGSTVGRREAVNLVGAEGDDIVVVVVVALQSL